MTSNESRFDPEAVSRLFFGHGHAGFLGMRYSDHGPDWVELKMDWREDLLGDSEREILASGPIVSLLDMASGMAIWSTRGVFTPIATLDLRVDYQRPATPRKTVFARAECYRETRSALFLRGVAHDGDPTDPVAHMAGVFMTIAMDPRDVS